MTDTNISAERQPDRQLTEFEAALVATDPQFAAAQPDPAVAAAVAQHMGRPGIRLPQIVRTVLDGYADRPALGQRAVEYVTDPATGRTHAALLAHYETVSYREVAERVQALGNSLSAAAVRPGDRVAVLGFTSVDYTVIDVTLGQIGAVAVPLQTAAAVGSLVPVVAETEPRVIAVSVDSLPGAVELALSGPAPTRVVVFDYHDRVDDHRDALADARARLSGAEVVVEPLEDLLTRGQVISAPPELDAGGDSDPLALLVYTSGSTGAPKGAMYPQSKVAGMWVRTTKNWFGPTAASITLNFMPMSHIMGRSILYGTLGNGGTAYFGARSDLSTLLDDLALVRPTELNCVPRVWEMLHQHFQSEVTALTGIDRSSAEAAVLTRMRQDLLGGRCIFAMTGRCR